MNRLKKYLFYEPKKEKCFSVKFYKVVILQNNFIPAFKEYQELKHKGFNLIMFYGFFDIYFFNTLALNLYSNYKLIK